MLAAYFAVLTVFLVWGISLESSRRFSAVLCSGWAATFGLEVFGLAPIMPYLDGLIFYALLLLALKKPERRFILCAQLATAKVGVHMAFNAVAYATGGWWTELGSGLGVAYMWSLNAVFLAMAVSLLWGTNVRSVVGVLLASARRVLGVPPRYHHARYPAGEEAK